MDNSLPPEILSHIFQLLRDIDPRSSLIVSWVSCHWRTVALSTCSLWDTITTLNPDMITEYINPCLCLLVTHRLQPRLQNICLRIVHADLVMEEDGEPWQKPLRMLFLPGFRGFRQLRSLSIGYKSKYIGNPTASDGLHVFTEAPELRNLRLRGLVVRSENCTSSYPLLKALSITNTHLDRSILFFLRKMPKLERLSLILIERYGPDSGETDNIDVFSPDDELTLDSLCQLRILRPVEDQLSDIGHLLARLCAPNLRHFEWEINYDFTATPLSFWQHCASRFHTLTSLHLMGFPSECSGGIAATQALLGWLESLHHLESFVLIHHRSYLFSSNETRLGMAAILEPLAELMSVVRARPRLGAGTLRIIQYVDTKRTAGDASWLQTNVSDFALETIVGHGRGFRYGIRYRYVGGMLRKYTSPFFESVYFDQTEQSELLV
ncbi:hypothetical protein B0J17DRAFT_656556 [Rhizoctonia solani]|nr:hypothetical protein B0J17DRAFT_656556 [Rhizoctonia solani]